MVSSKRGRSGSSCPPTPKTVLCTVSAADPSQENACHGNSSSQVGPDSGSAALPSREEEERRSESRPGGGAWLAVKVARFGATAAPWFVLRGNGDVEGRNPFSGFLPALAVTCRKESRVEVDVGGGVQPLLGGGKKGSFRAGGWLPAAPKGLSSSYSLRHTGTQEPKVSAALCVVGPPPSCPCLHRGLPGEEGLLWMHTGTQLCSHTHLRLLVHTSSPTRALSRVTFRALLPQYLPGAHPPCAIRAAFL